MRTTHFRAALLLLPFSIVTAHSAPIQNLTFTEVIKDVFVIDPATKAETPAKAGDKLVPPNVLKTGADSRAELIAEDKTVTRVGSNTIFSVEANSRDVNLAQGSVLFHSPAGRGGGRIKSAGATASVLGTTLAVSANSDGGFKTSLLEGKGEVKDPKGGKVGLVAGQVTFAKPGGGLSPALNFDLKAQISNSKLVGGFASPLASIAKIEAAVAVQQAKIAGGGLVSTGMLIGDRPDTAFKVDAAIVDGQIRQAQTRRIDQENATKQLQRFFDVDPRFTDFVLDNTRNSLVYTSSDTNVSERFFYINQTGRTVWRDYLEAINDGAIVGVPKNLPGNRLDSSYVFYPLIQKNISITLDTSKDNTSNIPTFFIPTPVDPFELNPPSSDPILPEKLSGGLVALDDIKLSGKIDFVNLDRIETSAEVLDAGLALLLSAGRTIEMKEGSEISSSGRILEIFTGGTQFSRDLDLLQRPLQVGETPVPLSLSAVSIRNDYDSNSPSGMIRITAPEIRLLNTEIISTVSHRTNNLFFETEDQHSQISLESLGRVEIRNDISLLETSKDSIRKTAETSKSIFLGFQKPEDICLTAFKVGIMSSSGAVELTSVNFQAKQVTLDAAKEISLLDVVISSPGEGSKMNVKAGGDVLIKSSNTNPAAADSIDAPNRAWISSSLESAILSSTKGNVTVENVWFGDGNRIASNSAPTTTDLTKFEVRAFNEVLLNSAAINADTVLFEGKTVKLAGVTVIPNDFESSSIRVSSESPTHVSGVSRFTAYDISFDAKNQMVLTAGGTQPTTREHQRQIGCNRFKRFNDERCRPTIRSNRSTRSHHCCFGGCRVQGRLGGFN
jgi:hypothetical protein